MTRRSAFTVEVFEAKKDSPMVVVSYEVIPRMPPDLSEAEMEVVSLMMRGRSNAEIASTRGTSVHTVANQVAEVFRKLDVNTRAELALRLYEKCAGCPQPSCGACREQ